MSTTPKEQEAPRMHGTCPCCRCLPCDLCGETEAECDGQPHVRVTLSDGSVYTACECCRDEHLPECEDCNGRYPREDLLPATWMHPQDHDICPHCALAERIDAEAEGRSVVDAWPDDEQAAEWAADNLHLPARAGVGR